MIDTVHLQTLKTRQLLALLASTRSLSLRCESTIESHYATFAELDRDIAAIKAVLATREHVPTGKEAKAIRQAKARAKRFR